MHTSKTLLVYNSWPGLVLTHLVFHMVCVLFRMLGPNFSFFLCRSIVLWLAPIFLIYHLSTSSALFFLFFELRYSRWNQKLLKHHIAGRLIEKHVVINIALCTGSYRASRCVASEPKMIGRHQIQESETGGAPRQHLQIMCSLSSPYIYIVGR